MPKVEAENDVHGIRSLAEAQFGVVARWQLLARGMHRHLIDAWIRAGRLTEIFHHVYAYGHTSLTREGRYLAAVLSAGPGAVLSCRAAATLWEIKRSGRIDVTTTRNVTRKGFTVHRVREPPEVTRRRGIPVTTPMRTLADLAEINCERRYLETAVDSAHFLDLFDGSELDRILTMRRRRKGASALREILETHAPGATRTASANEEAFLTLIDGAGLPRPTFNAPLVLVDGTEIRADAVWHEPRLIVEIDAEHSHARRFHSDRRRDALLQTAGWTIVRFTDVQIATDPVYVTTTLRALLAAARAATRPARRI